MSVTTSRTSAGDATPSSSPTPSPENEPRLLLDDGPNPLPDNEPQPPPNPNDPQHISDELLADPGNVQLDRFLLGRHACDQDCGKSWIQDLSSAVLVRMVKLDGVAPGTLRAIQQPPYHRVGRQQKWYCVFRGRKVGVFNDW